MMRPQFDIPLSLVDGGAGVRAIGPLGALPTDEHLEIRVRITQDSARGETRAAMDRDQLVQQAGAPDGGKWGEYVVPADDGTFTQGPALAWARAEMTIADGSKLRVEWERDVVLGP